VLNCGHDLALNFRSVNVEGEGCTQIIKILILFANSNCLLFDVEPFNETVTSILRAGLPRDLQQCRVNSGLKLGLGRDGGMQHAPVVGQDRFDSLTYKTLGVSSAIIIVKSMMKNAQVEFLIDQVVDGIFEGIGQDLTVKGDRQHDHLAVVVFYEFRHLHPSF
jgi:hypothetical protein